MRPIEAARIGTRIAFPNFGARGFRRYEVSHYSEGPSDKEVIPQLLKEGRTRFFAALLAKNPRLSQHERVGAIYLIGAIFQADNTVDAANTRASRSAIQLRASLERQMIDGSQITIGTALARAKAYLPQHERRIETFLQAMVAVHAEYDKTKQEAGKYTYSQALRYRARTNDPAIETLAAVGNIRNPQEISRLKKLTLLLQYVDDAQDLHDDVRSRTFNLLAGKAKDLSGNHPSELEALQEFRNRPDQQFDKRMLTRWIRENMPNTHREYMQDYNELVAGLRFGLAKVVYRRVGKKL